jgi:hypothetical protein
VLVRELDAIEAERFDVRRLLVDLDQLLAAAGIARDAEHRGRRVRPHDAGIDQRAQDGDGAGRIAAGIADALGGEQLGAVRLVELGEAIDPAVGDTVRGAGVDHAGVGVA